MNSPPERAFAVVATASAGVFAGSAVYISLVQHPALMRVSGNPTAFFRAMFRSAAPMQASLATLSGVAAVVTGLLQRERGVLTKTPSHVTTWIESGLAIFSVVPYTLVVMMKLNRQLLEPDECLKQGEEWVGSALRRWGGLHAVRTVASGAAFAGMLVALSYGTGPESTTTHNLH